MVTSIMMQKGQKVFKMSVVFLGRIGDKLFVSHENQLPFSALVSMEEVKCFLTVNNF